ncbi:alpha/beta fold hydrolase [Rhodococcus sp. ARC_M5]|uniref:alpha/beta fold hydrolase n=1 Tax=Rhodococcus sp. ARC_M5 TaxID=2928851 RepID=UPI001FB4F9D4|nr:alpha/beta fold hydrolase [Rhodococcus sp. ARC_M5]MCJ0893115.1 alpha/beta hydrolase [Rhodococcus sp. ARC_M5]
MPLDKSVLSTAPRGRRYLLPAAIAAGVIGLTGVVVMAAMASPPPSAPTASGDESGDGTPDIAALAGSLAGQQLSWETCEFNDDGPPIPGADVSNVECATIKVPRDWNDPDPQQTWDVRISQAHNIDRTDPDYHTTVITHPGGPYASGLSYSSTVQMYTPELRQTTNYVSFDQHGLGQSSHAQCEYQYDPADGPDAETRAIGESCSVDPEVATMTTEQTAFDMDFIRHLLGLESVTYMGYSYGTWLGAWYGGLFSDNIERMVLDSATDPTQDSIQGLYDLAHEGRDRQFRLHMMNWIARNDATYGLGGDPEVIWNRYFTATGSAEQSLAARYAWASTNLNVAFSSSVVYPFAGQLVSLIIAEGERAVTPTTPVASASRIVDGMDTLTGEQRTAAHDVLAALSAAPEDDSSGLVRGTYDEVIDFTKCTDGQWVQGLEYWNEFNERTALAAPFSAQSGLLDGPQACAFWPTDSAMPPLTEDFPESIVLQSELDSMTPWEAGQVAGTQLPNTSLIAVDNESVHGVFPYGTDEVDRPVIDFLLGGDRPPRTIVAHAKPMPLEEFTYESWTPIDGSSEHDGPVPRFTDPTIRAESGE